MNIATSGRHYTAADIPPGYRRTADGIINAHGIRLIRSFEGPPRTKARLCEGGRHELGPGVTFHLNGDPVLAGDTCDLEYGEALFANALGRFSAAVDRLVTVEIDSNQKAAMTAQCYNIGEANFSSSTVLRETNARRFEDAATAFGMWVYATKGGYKQAYRGLLRRGYAQGCLYLGYDWAVATDDDPANDHFPISLQRTQPPLINGVRRGTDQVTYKTPWSEVLRVAQKYPLDVTPQPIDLAPSSLQDSAGGAGELVLQDPIDIPTDLRAAPVVHPDAGAGSSGELTQPLDGPVAPPSPQPIPAGRVESPGPAGEKGAAAVQTRPPPTPPVGTKPKSAATVAPADVPYRIDPTAGLKPLDESDRVKGYWYQQFGIGIIRLGSLGLFGTTATGVSQKLQGDPVLSNLVLTGFVLLAVAGTGYVIKAYGSWRRKRGEKSALQGLY